MIIGTTSKIKLKAIEEVLQELEEKNSISFTILSEDVESQVPDTPFDDETLQGARNRANVLYEKYKGEIDLFIGLESGLVKRYENIYEECWCAIKDRYGQEVFGYSSGFMLPRKITKQMNAGRTHIQVLRELAEELQLDNKDTWSVYSRGILSRTASIKEAFRNALLSLEFLL
jgi:inosine/xanthosine triphosphatase